MSAPKHSNREYLEFIKAVDEAMTRIEDILVTHDQLEEVKNSRQVYYTLASRLGGESVQVDSRSVSESLERTLGLWKTRAGESLKTIRRMLDALEEED